MGVDEKLQIYFKFINISEPLNMVPKVLIVQGFSYKHIYYKIIGKCYKLDFL